TFTNDCSILYHPLSSTICLNATVTTHIYTLSLHDALPIYSNSTWRKGRRAASVKCWSPTPRTRTSPAGGRPVTSSATSTRSHTRSEEHTSELQSRSDLVCRLLLEKKKKNKYRYNNTDYILF